MSDRVELDYGGDLPGVQMQLVRMVGETRHLGGVWAARSYLALVDPAPQSRKPEPAGVGSTPTAQDDHRRS